MRTVVRTVAIFGTVRDPFTLRDEISHHIELGAIFGIKPIPENAQSHQTAERPQAVAWSLGPDAL